MKKKIFVICGAAALAVMMALGAILSCLLLKKPENADNTAGIPESDIINLIDYDFSAVIPGPEAIGQNTMFIYKEPCKLTENPELLYCGGLIIGLQDELENAFNPNEAQKADINDFVFEGQLYYHGWIYFNFTDHYVYYNGKIYRFNRDLKYGTDYLRENIFSKYTGSYKFGDPIPDRKFVSGTVTDTVGGYIVELFDDEPLAKICKNIKVKRGFSVGEKVTIEYTGYVEAGDPMLIPFCFGMYDYDPDFHYEKTTPEMLPLFTDKYSERNIKNVVDTMDYGNGEQFGEGYIYSGGSEQNEFFEANSIVHISFETGSSSHDYIIYDIYKNGDTLVVELYDLHRSDSLNCAIGYYQFFFALPKTELQGVEKMEYKYID